MGGKRLGSERYVQRTGVVVDAFRLGFPLDGVSCVVIRLDDGSEFSAVKWAQDDCAARIDVLRFNETLGERKTMCCREFGPGLDDELGYEFVTFK